MKHEARPGTARQPRRRSAVGSLIMALGICVMLGLVAKTARLPAIMNPYDARLAHVHSLLYAGQVEDAWLDDWLPVRWADGLSREVDEANDWIDEVLGPEITRGTPPEQDDAPTPSPAP